EALAPSADGERFLQEFYLTECADPVPMLRAWSARHQVPSGITVAHCARPQDLKPMLADADVLVIENGRVGTDELAHASSLKLIHSFGLVTDNIDHDLCRARGIAVRTLDRHTNRMVAEHVVMTMLALTRALDASREALRGNSS